MEWEKTNYCKKQKANHLFVSVSHPCNEKNIAKSMTILKLCERSFKWDLAGYPSSIRLEMALGWRLGSQECGISQRDFHGLSLF